MLRNHFLKVTFLVFLMSGCANTYHLYKGEPRPLSEVATIQPWPEFRGPIPRLYVWPQSIDGKNMKDHKLIAQPIYHILPGEHRIIIGFRWKHNSGRLFVKNPKVMIFTAEAGHLYLTKAHTPKVISEKVKVSFWIEDANTKEVVAGTRPAAIETQDAPDQNISKGSGRNTLKPPFEWEESFASPDTSLVIIEAERLENTPKGTMIIFDINSTGFSDEKSLTLWWRRGTDYIKIPVTLNENQQVKISPNTANSISIGEFVPGEAVDIALVGNSTKVRAHAKVVPFPIEAKGDGDCSANAEILSESGFLFLIYFKGFQSEEEVQIISQYKAELISSSSKADQNGEIKFPVLFGPPDRGPARATAKGKNCTVTLEYNVGKDALVIQ